MDKTTREAVEQRIKNMLPKLNEYQRRMYLAAEAKSLGRGGISLVHRLSGMSRSAIRAGIRALDDPDQQIMERGRSRKKGGGRKPTWEKQPGIMEALEGLVSPHTKGSPTDALLWTNKSLRVLAEELVAQGFSVCHRVVGELLKRLGYSLQANKKNLTVRPSHPDRDEQFEYINAQTNAANAKGCPVLSIDAKKKENIGNFKNNGRTYQIKGNPEEVLDHDFPIKELGKATPYGVYDIFRNKGFVNVGISHDTAAFAVESISRWWYHEGASNYAEAEEIVLTADCGGSNSYRSRLWKYELQTLANEIGKPIRVLHYPPGTSKWNKIEHRLFSFISTNWQGIPLYSAAIILSLIGATRTQKGLSVSCVLDESEYVSGITISDELFDSTRVVCDDFHGEWNYTIFPYHG